MLDNMPAPAASYTAHRITQALWWCAVHEQLSAFANAYEIRPFADGYYRSFVPVGSPTGRSRLEGPEMQQLRHAPRPAGGPIELVEIDYAHLEARMLAHGVHISGRGGGKVEIYRIEDQAPRQDIRFLGMDELPIIAEDAPRNRAESRAQASRKRGPAHHGRKPRWGSR